jgi:hypothetical protein
MFKDTLEFDENFSRAYNRQAHPESGEQEASHRLYQFAFEIARDQKTPKLSECHSKESDLVCSSNDSESFQKDFLQAASKAGIMIPRVLGYLEAIDNRAAHYRVKPEQIDKMCDHLRQVLETETSKSQFSREQLKNLVECTLHNLAYPREIDQGHHPTCNVTTVEVYVASKHPEVYADMMRQVALTGSYTVAGGKSVTPPKLAITPGRDELSFKLESPNRDLRNHASQVFQMTSINGMFELGHLKRNGHTPSDWRYIMGPSRRQTIPNGWIDLGEDLLVDGKNKPIVENGVIQTDPGFTVYDNVAASKMILGYEMPYLKTPRQVTERLPDGKVITHPWEFDLPDKDRLLAAKRAGNLPMGVPTMGGAHVQTIHDVSIGKSGQVWVLLDNQHGADGDGWVTLADLHRTQKDKNIELKPTPKASHRQE